MDYVALKEVSHMGWLGVLVVVVIVILVLSAV